MPGKNQALHRRFGFALAGLMHALRNENSFRLHIVATVGVLAALLVVRPEAVWWAVTALAVCAVLAAELFNTALEHLTDHLHPQQHPQIKIVKDVAAAAVLIVSLAALCVALAFVLHLYR